MSSHMDVRVRRVLIADDVPSLLAWAKRAFGRAGWEVQTADDGAIAWRLWRDANDAGKAPHLLVTDLNMPGVDGGALIELVRTASPRAPILVLTGLGADQAMWNVNVPSHTLLVRKPVTGADLIKAATFLLDGSGVADLQPPVA